MLLGAFVAVQGIQLSRTKLERDRANRERDRATRITDFMTGMFNVSDPSEARGNTVTAREILDKASNDIGTGLAKDPEAQAQMMHVMGNVYGDLGLYARAQPLLERSVEIRRRVLGPEHPDTLSSRNDLAGTLWREGHYAEAEKLSRETLEISRRVLGPEHPDTAESVYNLGGTEARRGNRTEALSLLRQALDHGLLPFAALGMEKDDDLKSLHGDSRFVALVAYANERATTAQNSKLK